jgi:hypothetical protein
MKPVGGLEAIDDVALPGYKSVADQQRGWRSARP